MVTQEIKDKLEQLASDYVKPFRHQLHLGAEEGLIMDLVGFAQTILKNPAEWGLYSLKDAGDFALRQISSSIKEVKDLKSQLTKYKEALERIANTYSGSPDTDGLIEIAEEALKQQ